MEWDPSKFNLGSRFFVSYIKPFPIQLFVIYKLREETYAGS